MHVRLLVIVLALVPIGADDPVRREIDKYQGTWVLVAEEFQGKPVAAGKRAALSCAVRGDQVRLTVRGEERSATVKLDPGRNPGTYDLARDDGVLSIKGIYAWDGEDTIKICAVDDDGDPPTEFKTGPGNRNRIRVWRRKKP